MFLTTARGEESKPRRTQAKPRKSYDAGSTLATHIEELHRQIREIQGLETSNRETERTVQACAYRCGGCPRSAFSSAPHRVPLIATPPGGGPWARPAQAGREANPGIDHEVANGPGLIVEIELLHRSNLPIRGSDRKTL